ncbi:MAG: tetratricopeptide repeat protein [Cyanobacteria bacterium J06623_5]
MEDQVIAAFAISDYQKVVQLLKQWQAEEPKSLLLKLYAGQLQEKTNRLAKAEKIYLSLLKQTSHRKIIRQARDGIQRIQAQQAEQKDRQKAEQLAAAKAVSGSEEAALFAIAPPEPAHRNSAVKAIANTFSLDLYAARQKLPASGLRLHRIGPLGELNYYAQQLQQAQIPTLCVAAKAVKALETFQICHFEDLQAKATVVCRNANGQLGKISFDWGEVSQQVSGQLPIFEQVVDLGNWGRTIHKEKVQDYAQVLDLHLPDRQIVLRMCDRTYQYQQGIQLTPPTERNSRIQWNKLLQSVQTALKTPHHKDFSKFGMGALEFVSLLPAIEPNLDIDRRAPSDWDLVFHLYSSLHFFNL